MEKPALPATPVAPISASTQGEGGGAATTVSETVVLLFNVPAAPEMVNVQVPTTAELLALNVNVLLLEVE